MADKIYENIRGMEQDSRTTLLYNLTKQKRAPKNYEQIPGEQ